MHERLKQLRKSLKLSQEFVANTLWMTRQSIYAIESGTRKVTTEELLKFSNLYGVSANYLLYGDVLQDSEVEEFANSFSQLSKIDKKEIMHLIHFKRAHRGR